MEELKKSLENELYYVRQVWFDANDNWYLYKVGSAVRSMTREEILGESKTEVSEPEQPKKKFKK